MLKNYKCWVPGDGEAEDDATDMIGYCDHEDAAQSFVDAEWSGREWHHHVDGDPILVHVVGDGERGVRAFNVRLVTSVDALADEVTT